MALSALQSLDDLLATDDLQREVSRTFNSWLASHNLPGLFQFGLITDNLGTVVPGLEQQGMPQFFVGGGSPSLWQEAGNSRHPRLSLALSHYQNFQIEVIQPISGTDVYHRFRNPNTDTSVSIPLHHFSVLVPNLDAVHDQLTGDNIPLLARGAFKFGPLRADFAYYDTLGELGLLLETSRWAVFGIGFRPAFGLIAFIARLQSVLGLRKFD